MRARVDAGWGLPDGRDRAERDQEGLSGRHRGRQRRGPRNRRRRVRRVRRALGVRQDHPAAADLGARNDHRRPAPLRRPGHQRGLAARAQHGHGLSELRSLSAHDRPPEHRVCVARAKVPAGGDRRAGERGGPHSRPRRAARTEAEAAFRRPAAARGHGAGDRSPSGRLPSRRAALQPGRQAQGAAADRAAAPSRTAWRNHDPRHARPGGGDDPGRPCRHILGRLPPAIRHPAGASIASRPTSSWPASSAARR